MSANSTTTAIGPRAPAGVSGIRPVQLVWLVLATVTVSRLWYATQLQLVPDEAYFWLWSKHLAASYRDKGPGVAWTIALGRTLFGDTAFGIRVFGVLLGTGSAWQLYRLAQRLYDQRTSMWCLVVALIVPLFTVGSVLMTPDCLSVFFWAWALNLFWTALDSGRTRDWLGLGLAIGAGFLGKFTNGLQLACFALFLCWSAPHRRFLFSRQSLATVLAFGFCTLPILWWNIQTGWIHAAALQERSGVRSSFRISLTELHHYLGSELGVLSPLLFIGMVAATVGLWRKHGDETRVRLLLTQYVPLQVIILLLSLNQAGEANWIAPSLIAGIILMVVFWRDLSARRPGWRPAIWLALGLAALMTAALHIMTFIGLPPRLNPLKRTEGWPDLINHVQQARQKYHPDVLTANHYSYASILKFYLPDHADTYVPPAPYGDSQFGLWPTYRVRPGTRALYVTEGTLPPFFSGLRYQFRNSKLVDEFWSTHHGQPVYQFQIYLLDND